MKKLVTFAIASGLFIAHAGLLLAAEKDEAEKLYKQTNGTWQLTSSIDDGEPAPAEELKDVCMELENGIWTTRKGETVTGKGTYKVLSVKDGVRVVSGTVTMGENKGKKNKHLSKSEGNTLTICLPGESEDVPTDFTSKKGSGRRLSVWKRVEK